MKKIFLSLIVSLSFTFISAKPPIEISGQIKDNLTKKGLEFCSVAAFNSKDSLIAGAVTNDNGFFSIFLESGVYYFTFSYIGYKTDTTETMYVTEKKFLGVFKLSQDEKLLKEFTVKSNSYDNQLDKDVQIVTEKMKAGATNTKEVLDKVNGVDYDRYSNSIKVDNDAKVMILVDGLEKDQEYIKNLSPDRLKKIEIIRDPGGRYALEGYSAVINVILKKDYQGTEFYLDQRAMLDPDAQNKKYIFIQNGTSGTLNYVYNKVNLYGKFGNNYNNFNMPSTDKQEYSGGLIIDKKPANNSLNTTVNELSNEYTIGADYYVNPKHTVSFESNVTSQPSAQNIANEKYNVEYILNGNLVDKFTTESSNKSKSLSAYNTLFYVGNFDDKNSINSNFTFSNYSSDYINTYKEDSVFKRIETGTNKKNSTAFYLDFTHTFNSKSNLQVGYGNTWQQMNNNYTVESVESNFGYSDIRNKLFAYYSWQNGKKLGIKIGCAGETSSPNSDGQKHSYLIAQPYADVKYKASKIIDLKMKYRSASNYPNISQTNPFTYVLDQYSIRTGNPNLRPEVTHKVSLETNILQGLMSIEPYYNFSGNYITEIGTLRTDSIFEYSFSNIGKYKNYGVQANLTIPFSKSLILQSNFNLSKSSIAYQGLTNNVNNFTMSNQLIYVREKSGLVVGFQYQKGLTKYITAQGYNKGNNDYWITFVQQPFFKKKLSLTLVYFTPITWGVDFMQGNYIHTGNYTETRNYDISFLKNIFLVELTYRFNKGKSVIKTEKNIERKSEKSNKGVL